MKFEDLGAVWKDDAGRPAAIDLAVIRERADGIDRAVRRRDRGETIVALALAPVFGVMAWLATSTLSTVGAAIVAVACLLIAVRLKLARRREPDHALPAVQAVEVQLAAIRAQQRLLGTVAWWYLTPLGVGVILYFAGSPAPVWTKVAYGVAVVVLYGWLLRLNLAAARRNLEPVAIDLERWLDSFRESHGHGVR
jgi:hypothetical protein